MRRVLHVFLWGFIVVVALGGALFGYFVYSPAPEIPRLSGRLTEGTIRVGGLKRIYLTYVPQGLTKGSTTCGGDARFGRRQCANANSNGVWVRAPCRRT